MSDVDSLFGDTDDESTVHASLPLTLPVKGRSTGIEETQRVGTYTLSTSPEPITERTNATIEIFSSHASSQSISPSSSGLGAGSMPQLPTTRPLGPRTAEEDYEFPIIPERPKKRQKLFHPTPKSKATRDQSQKILSPQEIFIHTLKTNRNVTSRLSELLVHIRSSANLEGEDASAAQRRTSELVFRLSNTLKTALQKAAGLSARASGTTPLDKTANPAPPISEIEASIWAWILKISGINVIPSSSSVPPSTPTSSTSLPLTPAMDSYDPFNQAHDAIGFSYHHAIDGLNFSGNESPSLGLPSAGINNSSLGLADDYGIWMLDFPEIQSLLQGDQWSNGVNYCSPDLNSNMDLFSGTYVPGGQDSAQLTRPLDPSIFPEMQIDPSLEDIVIPPPSNTNLSIPSEQQQFLSPLPSTSWMVEATYSSQQTLLPPSLYPTDHHPSDNIPDVQFACAPVSQSFDMTNSTAPIAPTPSSDQQPKSQKAKGKERAVDQLPDLPESGLNDSSGITAWRNDVADFGSEDAAIVIQQTQPADVLTSTTREAGGGTEGDPIIVDEDTVTGSKDPASSTPPHAKTLEFKKKASNLVIQARLQKQILENALAEAQSVLWCLEVEHSVLGGIAKIAAKKEAELGSSLVSSAHDEGIDEDDEEMEVVT